MPRHGVGSSRTAWPGNMWLASHSWVRGVAQPWNSFAHLGNLFNLTVSQFPCLQNAENDTIITQLLRLSKKNAMSDCLPGARNSTWLLKAISRAGFPSWTGATRVGLSPLSALQSLAHKKCSIHVYGVSICCMPGKHFTKAVRKLWTLGLSWCGCPCRPRPGEWAWLPCQVGMHAPPFLLLVPLPLGAGWTS